MIQWSVHLFFCDVVPIARQISLIVHVREYVAEAEHDCSFSSKVSYKVGRFYFLTKDKTRKHTAYLTTILPACIFLPLLLTSISTSTSTSTLGATFRAFTLL